ncbi:transposable element Tc1 transposase [Trichonephila clavipes]|nr:transposable element Tc1 transposase [Trichonephila clavipes]
MSSSFKFGFASCHCLGGCKEKINSELHFFQKPRLMFCSKSERSLWLEVEGSPSGTERTSPAKKCEGVSVDMHSTLTTSGCFYPRSNHWEKLEEGRSVTSVAAEFGIAHSIVSRLWRQLQTTGTAIRGFSSGRRRGITPADDRYIVLQARRNRRQTAGEIARHTTQATGRPISRFTVARRLHGGGLLSRRPVRCVPLTPAHRRRRSLWCRKHRNWRDSEWGRVLFTDESRFSLSSDSHRILIWRERGSRNNPSNIIEREGSVNGTRYCNEILLPYVRLFRGAMGLQFLFMDDNAPCHRTVAAEQLLESRRLAARTLPPVTIWELRLALQDEWQQCLNNSSTPSFSAWADAVKPA